MKFVKKILIVCVIVALTVSFCACGGAESGGGKIFKQKVTADTAQALQGTGETGGAISFTSRIAVYDLFAPSHVVVRVKLQNEFDYCEVSKKIVPVEQAEYSGGKLAIHQDFVAKWYNKAMERVLTVYDKKGNKAEIPFIIANKIIYTADEFQAINTNAASLKGYYVLGNDIDFTGKDYTMLGCISNDENDEGSNPFGGLLEGAGFTVSNISIQQMITDIEDKSGYIAGLIKSVSGAGKVRNLNVKNISVKVGGGISGGIVGLNFGKISNCYVESDIAPTELAFNEPSGGMIGFSDGDVTNCISYSRVDGMAFCGGNFGKLSNCYAVAQKDSNLYDLGGMLHVDAENPPYDVGFEVLNQFACDMFNGSTTKCEVLPSVESFKDTKKFESFPSMSWNISADGIKLYKMFLPNNI